MEALIKLAQIIVGTSVFYVWTFRFHNVLKEFEQFGISDLTTPIKKDGMVKDADSKVKEFHVFKFDITHIHIMI